MCGRRLPPVRAGRWRAGVKLRNLVDAILDVSRLEQGAMPLALEPVGLSEAIEEASELQRALAEPRKLRLANEVAAGFPRARADCELLSRILQNLVGNSIKFAPVGGQVRVGAVRDGGGMLRMTVADDGPGLPDDLRERVFERFVTGQHAASGSGLGLTFCRLAVEAQGGESASRAPRAAGPCSRSPFRRLASPHPDARSAAKKSRSVHLVAATKAPSPVRSPALSPSLRTA